MSENNDYSIRLIQQSDNESVKNIIRATFEEYGVAGPNTAYEDKDTFQMFQAFSIPQAVYYVIENAGKVLGGGGIMHLAGYGTEYCELQKLYFLPELRAKGYGRKLVELLMLEAQKMGYKYCYLESFAVMQEAIRLYEKLGFQYIPQSMGSTGHSACNIWMIKELP